MKAVERVSNLIVGEYDGTINIRCRACRRAEEVRVTVYVYDGSRYQSEVMVSRRGDGNWNSYLERHNPFYQWRRFHREYAGSDGKLKKHQWPSCQGECFNRKWR